MGPLNRNRTPMARVIWFREIGEERRDEARRRGFLARHFFPHRFYYLPKCGPDGFKLASRMCQARDPNRCWELVLYATGPVLDEFPSALFFDNELVWHQQQFGRNGQIATANLFMQGRDLYTMVHLSDLVQRISRRRDYKTRVENRFKGWHMMLLNSLANFALEKGVQRLLSPTAEFALAHTDRKRSVQRALFERLYDEDIHRRFTAVRTKNWWQIELARNRDNILPAEKRSEPQKPEKTICLCHDIEGGLGHAHADPSFAQQANASSERSLQEMLAIEESLNVRATYHIVGVMLPERRRAIERYGHCLAFHSYDHRVVKPPDTAGARWRRRAADLFRRVKAAERFTYQLPACRKIDYRLKGYRAPRSVLTRELTPSTLCHYNFEWLASSASSFGHREPRLADRLVRVPILFDDFDLYRQSRPYPEWERSALDQIAAHDFVAFSLHDCYAAEWLPRYADFLKKVRDMGRLETLDQVAAETFLAHAE